MLDQEVGPLLRCPLSAYDDGRERIGGKKRLMGSGLPMECFRTFTGGCPGALQTTLEAWHVSDVDVDAKNPIFLFRTIADTSFNLLILAFPFHHQFSFYLRLIPTTWVSWSAQSEANPMLSCAKLASLSLKIPKFA